MLSYFGIYNLIQPNSTVEKHILRWNEIISGFTLSVKILNKLADILTVQYLHVRMKRPYSIDQTI